MKRWLVSRVAKLKCSGLESRHKIVLAAIAWTLYGVPGSLPILVTDCATFHDCVPALAVPHLNTEVRDMLSIVQPLHGQPLVDERQLRDVQKLLACRVLKRDTLGPCLDGYALVRHHHVASCVCHRLSSESEIGLYKAVVLQLGSICSGD